jgi:formate-dependent nitrite reductase membrane component NrfD
MNPAEVSVVGENPGIFPSLHIWGWEIAVYLFLGGLVAGLLVLSGLAHWRSEKPAESLGWRGPLLAPVLLTAGMLPLPRSGSQAAFLPLLHNFYGDFAHVLGSVDSVAGLSSLSSVCAGCGCGVSS